MKTILALCLILCCCVSVEAGGRFNNQRNNAQRQRDFNRGVAAGLRAAQNGGGHCNSGRFNNPGNFGGGNRNVQLGLINFGR